MNQSKKLLAALVAIPASVVVAGEVQAAEVTNVETIEIKNNFVGNSSFTNKASKKSFTINDETNLKNTILVEMAKFTDGFTITYTGAEMANYKTSIETLIGSLQSGLNTTSTVTTTSDTTTLDMTELYGTFNNIRVKATETKTADVLTSVKLEFSINYLGNATELQVAKDKYTAIGVTTSSSDVAKVKQVHDYLIENAHHNPTNHRLNLMTSGGSSHAYALWAYTLLKQAIGQSNVRYVYGVVSGEYRSWNIVQLDGKWYHLDTFGNDTATSGSKDIKYRNFLTYTANERRIISGAGGATPTDTAYNYFKTMDNLAQSTTHIYYAAAETNGEIKQMNLATLAQSSLSIPIGEASTGVGKMVYFQQTSGDTTTVVGNYLYFINDSQGKYLYRYDLDGAKLELLLKEQLESIKLTPPSLTYKTTAGTTGFLPLKLLVSLDQEKANKVITEITKLLAITDLAQKKKVAIEARQLYIALTEEQRLLVSNYAELQRIETELAEDTQTFAIIDMINNLDEMKPNFVALVNSALESYNAHTNKAAIYNKVILDAASAKVQKARTLQNQLESRISSLAGSTDPFEEIEDFIVFIESALKDYDSFLPSIRMGIPGLNQLEDHRQKATTLRAEAQNFVNEVKIIDENALTFLTDMESIIAQQEAFLKSQKYLIRTDSAVVTQKINTANTMKQEITAFNTYMATLTTSDTVTVGNIPLTAKLVADMKAAKVLYDKMKPAQKAVINSDNVTKLDAIMLRINGISTDSRIPALEAQIKALNISTMTTLDELKSHVTTVDTAIVTIRQGLGFESDADVIALLSPEAKSNLELYRRLASAVDAAKTLQAAMGSLTNESPITTIQDLRTQYDALDAMLKKFFTAQLAILVEQEARLVKGANQVAADKIAEKINALNEGSSYTEVLAVYTEFNALSAAIKALVSEAVKAKLEGLWKNAQSSKATVDEVNKMIEALNEQSTREEIKVVEDAYAALADALKPEVVGYEKIAALLAALDQADADLTAKAAADAVIILIQNLTEESPETEILAARAAYDALSEAAKAIIPAKVLDTLIYFENRLTKLKEEAQAEAQVVIDRINRITNSYTEAQIKNIRMAYNELSALAKTLVTNLQKLIDAEAHILYQNTVVKEAKRSAAAFDEYMAKINRNSKTAEIAKARSLYNSLSAEAKKHVTTYEKLVRLETMWQDPEYLNLVYTYYPEYIHEIKPGGIVIQKPTYDPLDIPDDSPSTPITNDYTSVFPNVATWSPLETMVYQSGRYMTKITSTQVANNADRTMLLKADNIEIIVPVVDLKAASGTVGVSIAVANNQLDIQFTEGSSPMTFSETVEIIVPMSVLNGNATQMIERINATGNTVASFKIDGANFIIRTKTGGTFKATAVTTNYIGLSTNEQSQAVRALAQHGITYNTTGRNVQLSKQATRADVALFIATALDLSSTKKPKYLDLGTSISAERAQGLLEAGIMSGMTSSSFGPTAAVSKQEAAIIIANLYRYLNQDLSRAYNELTSNYSDVANLPIEARQSIAILELFGVESGSGAFNPNEKLSRGQFAEMFYKALRAIDYL